MAEDREPGVDLDLEAIGWLPVADPLREANRERAQRDRALREQWRTAERDEVELRAALCDVEVPAELETRLRQVPPRVELPGSAWRWWWVAALAAGVLLWVLARPGPSGAIDAEVDRVATQTGSAPSFAASTEAPRLVAVKFWHRTCPACRELDPRYRDVIAQMQGEPVAFLTLDMSTELRRALSAWMAEALGIGALFDARFGSSGYVILVDLRTHSPVGELTVRHDREAMERIIREALRRNS